MAGRYASVGRLDEHIDSLAGPIAVFGAGGFIGANLVKRLLQRRSDVFAISHQRFSPWRLLDVPKQNILHCDVRDSDSVDDLFERRAFRTIFCLSAFGAYARQSEAARIYETNFLGLVNVLTAAKRTGFSALVHAGSSSEYGPNSEGPAETAEKVPNSHYAVSKVACAYLIEHAGKFEGLPVQHLRYYSVYGPWEESDRLIPRLVGAALDGKLPSLVQPDVSRDFVFVDDAVDATILSAAKGVNVAPGASLNIASGKMTTLRELVEVARTQFEVREEPRWGAMNNRAWDLKKWFGNPAAAKEVLGWTPRTELAEGLLKTANWLKVKGAPPRIEATKDSSIPVRLSAIIACYKDAQAIPFMHQRLTEAFRSINVDYEILFVNDCSPDDTAQVLEKLCREDEHVVSLEHSRNFGSQAAFLSGMEVATGHAVILLDGDLQDPPEMIPQFFEKWMQGFEVVYGRRVRRDTGPVLQVCYKLFYRLFRKMAYVPIPVDAGDFSLIDARVVACLKALPETDQFLRGLRAWVGFRQTGVDYVRPERMFGRSTNNWLKNVWWARKAIFSFSFAPLDFLLYGGAGMTAFAFLGLAVQFVYRLLHPEMPHGTATIIILILLFGGTNILAASILGEYIGKVVEETKRRPRFIRHRIMVGDRKIEKPEEIESFVKRRAERSPAWLGSPSQTPA